MGRLKGEDYHRAHYVAGACNKVDDFCFLLARMQKFVRWPNEEGGEEEKRAEMLLRIVDIEGFGLATELRIPEGFLVVRNLYDDRDPDVQDGAQYLGNSHGVIKQTYNDSVGAFLKAQSLSCLLRT